MPASKNKSEFSYTASKTDTTLTKIISPLNKTTMKGMISKKKVSEQARVVNIRATVQSLAHLHQTSINKTSVRIGYTESYLSTALKKKDHHISLIVALSIHFQSNLLEHYFQLLPAHIRVTRSEKLLQQQFDEMEKQLLQLIQERDMLKEIAMRK